MTVSDSETLESLTIARYLTTLVPRAGPPPRLYLPVRTRRTYYPSIKSELALGSGPHLGLVPQLLPTIDWPSLKLWADWRTLQPVSSLTSSSRSEGTSAGVTAPFPLLLCQATVQSSWVNSSVQDKGKQSKQRTSEPGKESRIPEDRGRVPTGYLLVICLISRLHIPLVTLSWALNCQAQAQETGTTHTAHTRTYLSLPLSLGINRVTVGLVGTHTLLTSTSEVLWDQSRLELVRYRCFRCV